MRVSSMGNEVEREFKRLLEQKGHLVSRVAGSGNYKVMHYHDLHSTDSNGLSHLWEIKSTSQGVKFFTANEIERISTMKDLAESHNMIASVAVKFKGRGKSGNKFAVVSAGHVIQNRKVKKEEIDHE